MLYTLKEIRQQPKLWQKTWQLIHDHKKSLRLFLGNIADYEVIFTGAGSSFFVGEMVASVFQKDTRASSRAVATTEIVTHPAYFINPLKQTLLVSFARSGDSPESLAAVQFANQFSKKIKHLIITCNAKGTLAQAQKNGNSYVIVLPEEANDKSLAMTSSVTSMALAAILIGRLNNLDQQKTEIEQVANVVTLFFKQNDKQLKDIAKISYERAVFLGSGAMLGVAREAHLKLQELTDGHIISKFDSFLGFRHGPKAVVNEQTLIVYLFSNDSYVRQYEYDLVQSISKSQHPKLSIGIFNTDLPETIRQVLDVNLQLRSEKKLSEATLLLGALSVAQLLATYKSIQLDFNPDNPSKSGAIHRVVKGVTIYHK